MDPIKEFQGPNRWLSNFWPAWVKAADGTEFPTVEHAFQYEKFLGDWKTLEEPREKIKQAQKPGAAKKIADRYKHLLPADWRDRQVHVMRRLLTQKFVPNGRLGKLLKATGDLPLVEGNSWGDVFWGVCKGKGENWLGRLLMEIRSEL